MTEKEPSIEELERALSTDDSTNLQADSCAHTASFAGVEKGPMRALLPAPQRVTRMKTFEKLQRGLEAPKSGASLPRARGKACRLWRKPLVRHGSEGAACRD